MNDMTSVIQPKSDQINADDLIGKDMTITIRDVQIRGGQEQPVSIFFEGSDKAFRPCKSMSRVLVAIWGADARQYIGRSLTLYRDPTVKWGGMEVGGIRISHMSDMEKPHTMALTATKGARKPYTVKPLTNAPTASAAPVDGAANYARTFINLVEQCPDAAALDKLTADRAAKLEELRQKRPELHAEVDTAIGNKRASFGADDWSDGPADTDRGESHQIDADWLIGKIENLTRVDAVNGLVESWADAIAGFEVADRARVAEAQASRVAELKSA